MRHVLMTADAIGGVWTYATDLARALGERDIAVTLAVMGPHPDEAQCAAVRTMPHVTLRHQPFRLEWMEDPWSDVKRAGSWLLDLEQEVHPDVVHLNGYCHAALPWNVPVLVAAHSCVLSWWSAVHGSEPPPEWDRYAAEVSAGLFEADLVVAPTAAMMAAINYHYGPLLRTKVIPNGRAVPTLNVQSGIREPFIVSSGRLWDEAKNIELLARCANELSWPVYVAGECTSPSGGTVSLPNVTCLGRLAAADVLAWMQRASIYALPARYEPFGLSAVEAALSGCALVLGDIRSLREVWDGAAMFVPAGNRRALVNTLQLLIESDAVRADLAALAHTRARALTVDRMADGYCAAYLELAASTLAA
jgi:glycosyltransferase involved in cell wall biosynthesis